MKAITIRNIPDALHQALLRLAQRNRRSLQQQLLVLLENTARLPVDSPIHRAQQIRQRLSGRQLGDSVAEIREERLR